MTEQHAPDPGSFAVDLRAVCEVDWIRLAFTADASDPVFTPPFRNGPHGRSAGRDVRPSYPLEFVVETSTDSSSRPAPTTPSGPASTAPRQAPAAW
ncbi:hypothetical protein ABID80_001347 [Streptomyces sp. PvP037]|uniref:hypothetical protein n=1 Tax=Streptomyces sp. PvP037 TaxID=3156437 RepID=UPI0033949095